MATRVHTQRVTVLPHILRGAVAPERLAVPLVEGVVRDAIERGILDERGDPVEVLRSLTVRVEVGAYGLAVVARTES